MAHLPIIVATREHLDDFALQETVYFPPPIKSDAKLIFVSWTWFCPQDIANFPRNCSGLGGEGLFTNTPLGLRFWGAGGSGWVNRGRSRRRGWLAGLDAVQGAVVQVVDVVVSSGQVPAAVVAGVDCGRCVHCVAYWALSWVAVQVMDRPWLWNVRSPEWVCVQESARFRKWLTRCMFGRGFI